MKIVALEEHMLPADIVESAGLDLGIRAGSRADSLNDVGEGRLALMDAAGIDVQVLSALAWFVQDLEPVASARWSRGLNDRMAKAVADHPDRFHLDRIESMLGPVVTGLSRTISATLRHSLYLTTSGYHSDPPLQCALAQFGAEHILFSVDHPFAGSEQATGYLASAPVSEGERNLIAHANAEALLGI